jgi:hypothetical protein
MWKFSVMKSRPKSRHDAKVFVIIIIIIILHVRGRHVDAVFLINAFKGNIACPSILD